MNEPKSQDTIYRRIGEYVVSFQGLENQLREIGWFILDPNRETWPRNGLRNLNNQNLINEVHKLFVVAIPKCNLPQDLERYYIESFAESVAALHRLRKHRNRMLHSAFIEMKAGGKVTALIRSNPKIVFDNDAEEWQFDRESLSANSFESELYKMAQTALFLERAYRQLIHRYLNGSD